jgi:hypothetical protein
VKKAFITVWAVLCAIPTAIPGFFLFVYQHDKRGPTDHGWGTVALLSLFFWGSLVLAIILTAFNGVVLGVKPELLINKKVAVALLCLTLMPLLMSLALLVRIPY